MKKLFLLPMCLAAFALSSCAVGAGAIASAGSSLVQKVTAAGDTVVLKGTAGLIIAEEFYQAANRTALAAVRTGKLSNATLDRIQALNTTATAALRRGKAAANEADQAKAAADVMTAALSLRSIGSQ